MLTKVIKIGKKFILYDNILSKESGLPKLFKKRKPEPCNNASSDKKWYAAIKKGI